MAAAKKTPSVVQRSTEQVQDAITGTPVRITKFKLKVGKVTTDDWIVTTEVLGADYPTSKIVGMSGIVIPAGGDAVQDVLTVDDSEDYVILDGATVGDAWVELEFTE